MTRIADISHDSETSSTDGTPEERIIKTFCKSMLKNSLFIGTFLERRHVVSLNAYRDIIKISDEEKDFIQNLLAVKKRCAQYYLKSTWIGITEPDSPGTPVGYNLWTNLNENVFGRYWFKVKRVIFRHNEITLKLEIIRRVTNENSFSQQSTTSQLRNNGNNTEQSYSELFEYIGEDVKKHVKDSARHLFTEVITVSNIKESITFLFLLIFSLLTFVVEAMKYLMDYSLKFVKECSGLIKASTPILQSILGLVMNTINGILRLIAMLFLSNRQTTPQVINYIPISDEYEGRRQVPRAIQYPGNYGWNHNASPKYRSSVKITPLD